MKERKIVTWTVLVLIVLILVDCLGIPGVAVVFRLPIGWAPFLLNVAPRIHVRWGMVASAAVYVAALIIGSHLFLRWLYREMTQTGRWRWRWTLSGIIVLILMFTSGMAAIGIVHQTGWLITSPVPIFKSNDRSRELAIRIKCKSNLWQIRDALDHYAKENGGEYPDDFRELMLHEDITAVCFVCPASNDEATQEQTKQAAADSVLKAGHCSYIYLGKGLTTPVDPKRIIAFEPLADHQGVGMNVLFGDGSVRFVEKAEAEKMLAALGVDTADRAQSQAATTQPTPQ